MKLVGRHTDPDNPSLSLGQLKVWRDQARRKEYGSDDTDGDDRLLYSASIGALKVT